VAVLMLGLLGLLEGRWTVYAACGLLGAGALLTVALVARKSAVSGIHVTDR